MRRPRPEPSPKPSLQIHFPLLKRVGLRSQKEGFFGGGLGWTAEMGERQSITQKGVRTIDAPNSAPRNGSNATKTNVRAPGLSTDEREDPFVWYFGAGCGKKGKRMRKTRRITKWNIVQNYSGNLNLSLLFIFWSHRAIGCFLLTRGSNFDPHPQSRTSLARIFCLEPGLRWKFSPPQRSSTKNASCFNF